MLLGPPPRCSGSSGGGRRRPTERVEGDQVLTLKENAVVRHFNVLQVGEECGPERRVEVVVEAGVGDQSQRADGGEDDGEDGGGGRRRPAERTR